MKRERRILFRRIGEAEDGTALYNLYIDGRLRAQAVPMDEVIRAILEFEEETL